MALPVTAIGPAEDGYVRNRGAASCEAQWRTNDAARHGTAPGRGPLAPAASKALASASSPETRRGDAPQERRRGWSTCAINMREADLGPSPAGLSSHWDEATIGCARRGHARRTRDAQTGPEGGRGTRGTDGIKSPSYPGVCRVASVPLRWWCGSPESKASWGDRRCTVFPFSSRAPPRPRPRAGLRQHLDQQSFAPSCSLLLRVTRSLFQRRPRRGRVLYR